MGALPRPNLVPGPHRDLVDALHDLHHRAGWPSLRTMARTAGCSHTTVSSLFSDPRLPSWGVLELVVEALQGDVAEFHERWLAAGSPEGRTAAREARIAGRREELAVVREHLCDPDGGLLLVAGEAGIGKSRLVAAASALARQDTFVATGTCLQLSTAVPLLPFADVLHAAHEAEAGEWMRKALAECPPYVHSALGRLVPELDPLDTPSPEPGDDWAFQRLLRAMATVLTALGTARPLAIVLEDIHWADTSSLDVLEYLLSRPKVPSLVATWRLKDPETRAEARDWWARVRRLTRVRTLELSALDRDETAEQLTLLLGHQPPAGLLDGTYRRSRGHPLFTEQLAAAGPHNFPEQLGQLLDRRLDGLGQDAWDVAKALGVADRGLSDSQLEQLTGRPAERVADGLRELAARFLTPRPEGHVIALRHPLLVEAVRRRLTARELVDEHSKVAALLARSDGIEAAEVAEHYRRAEDPGQELPWRVQAARDARARFALPEQYAHWRRALDLDPGGPEAGASQERRMEAFVGALDALEMVDAAAGWELAQEAMRELTSTSTSDAAEVYFRAALFCSHTGDPERALLLAERAVRIYEALPPCARYVKALGRQAHLLEAVGRSAESAATATLALDVAERLGDPLLYRRQLAERAIRDSNNGELESALARIRAAATIESDRPDPAGVLNVSIDHVMILTAAGAGMDEVVAAAAPGLEAAQSWGADTWLVSVLRQNVAAALRQTGDIEKAAELIDPVTVGAPGYVESAEQCERADLDVIRGELDAATARFEALSRIPTDGLYNYTEFSAHAAMADLWSGRADQAWRRLLPTLRAVAGTEHTANVALLFMLSARAAADRAELEGSSPGRRRLDLEQLRALLAGMLRDPFASLPSVVDRPALAATWGAETARLDERPTVESWAAAGRLWESIRRPHEAAYCWWRAGQLAGGTGQGTLATRLLHRAAKTGRGHVPLLSAVQRTAALLLPPPQP